MTISVRRLGADDWRTWRDVRLAALADAPDAFASSLARERDYDEAGWRERLDPDLGMKAVACADRHPVGLVGAWVPQSRPGAVELFSMWVDPSWRGRGVGDLLVTETVTWARENHHKHVELWVVDDNVASQRLYHRHGFRATGEDQPHPGNPGRRELRMAVDVD